MSEQSADYDAPFPIECTHPLGHHLPTCPRVTPTVALAEALFAWNTPTDPYFVIHGRAGDASSEDPYLPIARATLAALAALHVDPSVISPGSGVDR